MVFASFSIGGLNGWAGILLGLAVSAVFTLSGRQDWLKNIFLGAVLWLSMALFAAGAAIWLGFEDRIWAGALLGLLAFCSEVWLIQRWWREQQSRKRELTND